MAEGMEQARSSHTVEATVARIEEVLAAKGVTVFAVVDHSGEAARAGLQMRPTKLVVFGSPKLGTPLMVAAPSTAIDLPLKLLVWEGEDGSVWVGWNTGEYLQARHGFPVEMEVVAAAAAVVGRAAAG
jgi:uncharacterized protein (DUF302 family)